MYFSQALEVEVLNIPHLPEKGAHKVFFDPSNLYIDASDFKEVYTQRHMHTIHIHYCRAKQAYLVV